MRSDAESCVAIEGWLMVSFVHGQYRQPSALEYRTARARIIQPRTIYPLELPFPARSGTFYFFCLRMGQGRWVFVVVSPPKPER